MRLAVKLAYDVRCRLQIIGRPFGWGWREAVCSWTALWGCTVASLLVSDKTQVDECILLAPPAVAKL